MKKKVLRISCCVLACFIVAGIFFGKSFRNCENIFTESRREVLTNLDLWKDADPNDHVPDNAHGAYAMMSSFSADEILYLYENGKFNVHHLAMIYAEDPVTYAILEPYAKQSEYYDEYVKLNSTSKKAVKTSSVETSETTAASTNVEAAKETASAVEEPSETTSSDVTASSEQSEISSDTNKEVTSQPESNNEGQWEVLETVDPVCEEDGSITYVNATTGDTKTESIEALGHDEGKWITVVKPTLFKAGVKELRCTRDHILLDTKKISPIIPLWAIVLITVVVIITIILIIIKKTRNRVLVKPKLTLK